MAGVMAAARDEAAVAGVIGCAACVFVCGVPFGSGSFHERIFYRGREAPVTFPDAKKIRHLLSAGESAE